jgi:ribosomal protein S18 acetylase RimI-like enzyme
MSALNPVLIRIRAAAPQDREFLWWLHRETMRDYVHKTWGWDDSWQRERFDENFDPARLQIIEYEGRAFGCISVERPGNEIFLAAIEVAPEFQNNGVGTYLVGKLLEESDQLNLSCRLLVLKVNPARRLYERMGFERTGETSTHYVMRREPGR